MKTPKQKAEELVQKFGEGMSYYGQCETELDGDTIRCALIACDEIIIELFNSQDGVENKIRLEYWQEVKNELQKM